VKLDAKVSEPLRDRKKVDFPARVAAGEIESTSDLKKDDLSTGIEAELTASANDLNHEACLVTDTAEPTETNRFSVLPVKREVPRVRELVNVRMYENLSAIVEDTPIVMVRNLGKFLPTEPAVVSELVRDLRRAKFRARLEPEPNDIVGDLNSEVLSVKPETEESEPAKDLKKETFSAEAGLTLHEPVNILSSDICLAELDVNPDAALRDLNNEDCSAKVEDGFSAEFRLL
jgi:hypothetical protein